MEFAYAICVEKGEEDDFTVYPNPDIKILEKLKHNMTELYHQKEKQYLNMMSSYLFKEPTRLMDYKKNQYIQTLSKLEALSPLSTIKRGYSVIKKEDTIITSVKSLKPKDQIQIDLSDGAIDAQVI